MASGSSACPPGYTIDENEFCRSECGIPNDNRSSQGEDSQTEIIPDTRLVPDSESEEVNLEFYAIRVYDDHDLARGAGEWDVCNRSKSR